VYTAAAVLASGAVEGRVAEILRGRVEKGLREGKGGHRYVEVPAGVVRPDGATPDRAEVTALAILALGQGPQPAARLDLGAFLLSGYSPARGWGDGRSNFVCF